jgi:hypothetical protein
MDGNAYIVVCTDFRERYVVVKAYYKKNRESMQRLEELNNASDDDFESQQELGEAENFYWEVAGVNMQELASISHFDDYAAILGGMCYSDPRKCTKEHYDSMMHFKSRQPTESSSHAPGSEVNVDDTDDTASRSVLGDLYVPLNEMNLHPKSPIKRPRV